MGNLLVAGCSVSDYTHVDKVWGEYLAEELNLNYIHEGAGCGSNWRMWRIIVDAVKSKRILPDDIVLLQYTEVTRREFWSPNENKPHPMLSSNKAWMNDVYGNGNIIRYKLDADKWIPHKGDKKFFSAYNRHVDQEFEEELFAQQHSMFQCFMKQHGFNNVYFVLLGQYGSVMIDKNNHLMIEPCYKDNCYHNNSAFNQLEDHLPNDCGHFSELGHANLAKDLGRRFQFDINT